MMPSCHDGEDDNTYLPWGRCDSQLSDISLNISSSRLRYSDIGILLKQASQSQHLQTPHNILHTMVPYFLHIHTNFPCQTVSAHRQLVLKTKLKLHKQDASL